MTRFRFLVALAFSTTAATAQITGFAASGSISRENRPRLDSLAGNGIDLASGAFLLEEQVLTLQGSRPLGFTLHYNSLLTATAGALGRGWSHEYEAFIDGDPNGIVTVHWDMNRANRFRFAGSGQPYEPLDETVAYDELRQEGSFWRLTLLDGTHYDFDLDGRLVRIRNRVGQAIEADWVNGRLAQVRETSGKQIRLEYAEGSNRLQYIEDSFDRIVYFGYNSEGVLETIRAPVTPGFVEGPPTQPQNIPDSGAGSLTRTITVTRGGRIGLVKLVGTSIAHPRPGDLRLLLRSPQGTTVGITAGTSSSFWDLSDLVLDVFDGEDARGNWTMTITDVRQGQSGRLNGWRMRFTEPTDRVAYEYNSFAQIVRATDPQGKRLFANTYDTPGRVISQDDGRDDNRLAEVSYQETGARVTAVYRDRVGAASTLEHDASYRLLSITGPLGARTAFTYNARGDRTAITDPLGRTTRLAFSPQGHLTSLTNPEGAAWSFEHSNGDLTSVRDPLGKRTEFEYQGHKLVRVKDAECLADPGCAGVRKTYAGDGVLMSNTLADGAGINYTWRNGRPVGATQPSGNGLEQAEYDGVGRVIRFEDADGHETRLEHNSSSQIVSQTDPLGAVTRRAYDRRGQVVESIAPLGNTTRFAYDGNGNLIARTNPLGETTRYEYDGEDRLVRTVNPKGNASTREFDAAGRLIRETDATGVTLRHQYDAADNRIATYDSNGVAVERVTYGPTDLPVTRADAFDSRFASHFDELARLIEVSDPLGQSEILTYDRNDRLRSVRDRLRRTRAQDYAPDNVVLSITNAKGESQRFDYDAANRLIRIRRPDSRVTSLGYNRRDLVTFEQLGDSTHEYTYDAAGRLIEILRDHSELLQFDLDANANVTAIRSKRPNESAARVRLRFDYDPMNRLQRFTDRDGNTLRYAYDAAGNLASLTYPDGSEVRYSYDAAERLSEIVDWANRRTRYTYDNNGRLTRVQLPNGVTQQFVYDKAGRLVRRTDGSGSGTILDVRYTYDVLGQVSSAHATPAPPAFSPGREQMTYGADNQLATYNGTRVTYDSRGAMTFGPLAGSFATFAYDLSGNLARAGSATYSYDEQDRLIAVDGSGGTTRFVTNPAPALSQPVVRIAPDGSVTRYVWGPGLVYEERAGRIRTYHYDFAGSTVALVDEAGAISGTVAYGPWGEITSRTGAVDTPFLYGGLFGFITDSNGLVSMRYRWYSPQIKRFLNQDSEFGRLGFSDGTNLYAYAGSNPVNFTDPNGRLFGPLFGAIAGAIVNTAATTIASYITTGRPPTPGELAGAALEGAITGALLATCGPGCGVLGGALIGAVGAAAGSATGQAIDTGRVDPAELGIDTGFGLGFGALGGAGAKAGKGARLFNASRGTGPARPASFVRPRSVSPNAGSRRGSKAFLELPGRPEHLVRSKASVPRRSLSARFRVEAILAAQEFRRTAAIDITVAAAQSIIAGLSEQFLLPAGGGDQSTRMTARAAGRANLNGGTGGTSGKARHYGMYLTALGVAGRPEPNPAPALAAF